jgi:hypothetical protein
MHSIARYRVFRMVTCELRLTGRLTGRLSLYHSDLLEKAAYNLQKSHHRDGDVQFVVSREQVQLDCHCRLLLSL